MSWGGFTFLGGSQRGFETIFGSGFTPHHWLCFVYVRHSYTMQTLYSNELVLLSHPVSTFLELALLTKLLLALSFHHHFCQWPTVTFVHLPVLYVASSKALFKASSSVLQTHQLDSFRWTPWHRGWNHSFNNLLDISYQNNIYLHFWWTKLIYDQVNSCFLKNVLSLSSSWPHKTW